MVSHIQLLSNVGQFENATPGAQLPFSPISILYAENGRGKTTMAAIFRSVSNGDATLIADRHRVGAANPPHIVLNGANGAQHIFQNGAWTAPMPEVVVFDDSFVSENICSGIEIETGHRQNLHELILGAQGVALNEILQRFIVGVEQHNQQLRVKEAAIPQMVRFGLTAEEFCSLQAMEDVDVRIQEAERALAAGQASAAVQAEPEFSALSLPAFDIANINGLLGRGMAQLDAAAAAKVQTHLSIIGPNGERWVSDGVAILASNGQPWIEQDCPFCAQSMSGSELIDHYRAYFSEEYAALNSDLNSAGLEISANHKGEAPAAFERDVRTTMQRREFWQRFLDIPKFDIDTADIARSWKIARETVMAALKEKRAAPMDAIQLSDAAIKSVEYFHEKCREIGAIFDVLKEMNGKIAVVKEQAQVANIPSLTNDLSRLKAVRARHSEQVSPLCKNYLDEKAAKAVTEAARDAARIDLDNYRHNIFPAYEVAINNYLVRFNAGFRLGGVSPVNSRTGSSATYNVVINNIEVPLKAAAGPSFRTALSAGDRNTLALAFFFASLDQTANLADTIVVIDDPMTSLDEHRYLVTVQEIRGLIGRVSKVIVLSHSKPFLIALWKAVPTNGRVGMRIARAAAGSIIEPWDVNQDSITEHDHRFARATAYVQNANPAYERIVAADLRHMLEAFLRVAYASHYPPGTMVGQFCNLCQQRLGTPQQILNQADCIELRAVLDFANRYHHDSNPTYQTEIINDAELTNFASRTLAFIRRN